MTMTRRLAAIGIVVAILLAGLLYSQRASGPLRVSGFIEADEIRVGSRVGGRIARVAVEEGQTVQVGDLLLQLEPFDLGHRVEEAEANLASRRADLDRLQRGFREEEIAQAAARVDGLKQRLKILEDGPRPEEIEAARARQRLAVAQLDRAQKSFERNQALATREVNAVSRDTLDRATEDLRVAEAGREVRDQELRLLERGNRVEEIAAAKAGLAEAQEAWRLTYNGSRAEDVEKAKAAVVAAEAALKAVRAQVDELSVRAPVAGSIDAVDLQPGDLVAPNAPMLSLIDTSHLWVRAYVPENRIGLKIGQKLSVTVDSFPGERFRGELTYLSRQAEFTPSNVQTPEERSKQVFRIKVTLREGLDRLRPGMAADVWLEANP